MDKRDEPEFFRHLKGCYELYGKRLSPIAMDLFLESLKPYALMDVCRALSAHVRNTDTGQFPPKPADVLRYLRGDSNSTGNEAWAKVDRAIRCVGHYRSVVFDDPKIHAAIEQLGGWIKVATTDADEYRFLPRRFQALYAGFAHAPPSQYPRKLIGAAEHHNQMNRFQRGRANDQPAVIGNIDQARLVFQGGSEQATHPIRLIAGTDILNGVEKQMGIDHEQETGTHPQRLPRTSASASGR